MIHTVAVKPTLTPEQAMIEFKNYFDKISRTHKILQPTPATSPLNPNIPQHDIIEDTKIGDVTNVQDNKVMLGELIQHWDYKVIDLNKPQGGDRTPDSPGEKPGLYGHRKDQHVVDHVLCHLTGYNVYEKRGKGHSSLHLRDYIEGRDIILFAVMYAVPEIQRGLKKMIMEEFK